MLVGEAPGRISLENRRPFSGPGGKLLRDMLSVASRRYEMKVPTLEEIFYITDLVKCGPMSPTGTNRPPVKEEWRACASYLAREIDIRQSRLVLIAGYRNAERILDSLGIESVDFHKEGWKGLDVPAYRFQHPSPINPYTKTLDYRIHLTELFSRILVDRLENGGGESDQNG